MILVDAGDREVGTAAKLDAHRSGALHRAVSVLVGDGNGNFLLQQRAEDKYHSPGLWTNSCCGHPRPHESAQGAAVRRLFEEMGVSCSLEHVGSFQYRAELGNGLTENEIDHVFVGHWRGDPRPDPSEVSRWRWMSLSDIQEEMARHPERFTAWFAQVLHSATRGASAPAGALQHAPERPAHVD